MKKNVVIAVLLLIIGVGVVFILNQEGYLPLDSSSPADQARTPETSESAVRTTMETAADSGGTTVMAIRQEDIRRLLDNVDAGRRQALLEDPEAFREFVRQEALNRSLLAAARSNGVQDEDDVQFLMQRNADNALREIYINRLLANNTPSDFPSEQQIRQFYEENPESMVQPEQVPVWQVFLQVTEDMDETEISSLAEEAERISQEIRANDLDFASAALQYSQHQASRTNGGYMGLLKLPELLPGIRETLLELDEGEVSAPLKTQMGFHVLMRGDIMPARELGYEEVYGEISNHLINQAQNQIRNQIAEKVQESFPVEVDDADIEAWRESIRSALQ